MITKHKTELKILNITFVTSACLASINCGFAQQSSNNFFGTMPGTSGPNQSYDDPPGANTAQPAMLPPTGGDYTPDEKRMRKKYKAQMRYLQHLIEQGRDMMNSSTAESQKYKKGKILVEIGERNLAEMKANSPFPDKSDKSPKQENN